jgi:hypothetical protein
MTDVLLTEYMGINTAERVIIKTAEVCSGFAAKAKNADAPTWNEKSNVC